MGSVASACTRAAHRPRDQGPRHPLQHDARPIRIGRVVARERASRRDDAVAALVEAEQGVLLFKGKVQDVERARPKAFRAAVPAWPASTMIAARRSSSSFQNEYAAAWRDGEVVATTPDIICTMDSRIGRGDRHRDAAAAASAVSVVVPAGAELAS